MTIDDARAARRRVVVGPTREAAAAAFGRTSDDLFITSYADLEHEVDLDQVDQLDVVCSAGAQATLVRAGARLGSGSMSVRVAVRPWATDECADLLERADVEVIGVEAADGLVLLRLGPSTQDSRSPRLVLQAIAAASGAGPSRPSPPTAAASRPVNRARRTPPLLHMLTQVERWRHGRRRRLALAAVATAVVVALLLIGVLPDSAQLLTSIGVPLLLVVTVASAATTVYVTLLLARQVHRQTGRLERSAVQNRKALRRRIDALSRRLDHIDDTQSRLPFLEQYVEAVAEHSAASNARLRELLESLELKRDDER